MAAAHCAEAEEATTNAIFVVVMQKDRSEGRARDCSPGFGLTWQTSSELDSATISGIPGRENSRMTKIMTRCSCAFAAIKLARDATRGGGGRAKRA